MDLDSVLCRSPELVFSEVDGEIMMMNVETGRYYGLTRVGARVWALMEEPVRVRDVCDRLLTQYRVDRGRCEGEVLSLVRRMREEGLVIDPEPSPGGPPPGP